MFAWRLAASVWLRLGEYVERPELLTSAGLRQKHGLVSLALFIAILLLLGASAGIWAGPDAWYVALHKPAGSPSPRLFSTLALIGYIVTGIVGWRLWWGPRRLTARIVWFAQVILSLGWQVAFFGAHQTWLAFAILFVLWAMLGALLILISSRDMRLIGAFLLLMAWVGYCAGLVLYIAVQN